MSRLIINSDFVAGKVSLKELMSAATRFKDGVLPPQAALEKIIKYFFRVQSPVYLGFISMELGHGLATTEWMVEALVDQKKIRELSVTEKRGLCIDDMCSVYVLV